MEPRIAATRVPDPDAVEFIRFCYRRRRVGWPELYDEMCAVASRGLFRGYSADDLAPLGIGFSLYDMPALAALARRIVAEEVALRRPVTVTIAPLSDGAAEVPEPAAQVSASAPVVPAASPPAPTPIAMASPLTVAASPVIEPAPSPAPAIRFAPVPAGA